MINHQTGEETRLPNILKHWKAVCIERKPSSANSFLRSTSPTLMQTPLCNKSLNIDNMPAQTPQAKRLAKGRRIPRAMTPNLFP